LLIGSQTEKRWTSERIAIARVRHGRISQDKGAGLQTRTGKGQAQRSNANDSLYHNIVSPPHCEHIAVRHELQQVLV
jgi:hypothetical protein